MDINIKVLLLAVVLLVTVLDLLSVEHHLKKLEKHTLEAEKGFLDLFALLGKATSLIRKRRR